MRRLFVLLVMFSLLLLGSCSFGTPQAKIHEVNYRLVLDGSGEVIAYIDLPVTRGDIFLAADNRTFQVIRVEGDTAYVKEIEE